MKPMWSMRAVALGFWISAGGNISAHAAPQAEAKTGVSIPFVQPLYKTISADGVQVFYREAGDPKAPAILLLHGFPSSSHMFRNLIPELAQQYHVIAPDMPGFGFTTLPAGTSFRYTFDNLARILDAFTVAVKLNRYALYVFDYGAPVGWRLASAHPEKITAIISQNGNAYVEGLSDGWKPIQSYWKRPTAANRAALRTFFKPETTKWQYTYGTSDASLVSPDGYTFDQSLLERKGQEDIQLDLFLDYANNVALYPKFHEYFHKHQPPLLAIWGKNDPFFLPAGAEAFKRDLPQAEVVFLNTGHFALETHYIEIGAKIREFLQRRVK